ncbi:transmembrane protein, putative [Medicago truncatula]|uniref:Transmembrane protein, putative n=1 Tax=Medicago truncatula TaxID=3880 RepID=G7IZ56_MEDTR|nr:transmembrane protein, putative [Medicago truncatula]
MIHIIGYSPTGLYVLQMVTCGGVNWLVLCWFCYGVGRHAATVVLWDIDYGQLLVLMGSAKTASVLLVDMLVPLFLELSYEIMMKWFKSNCIIKIILLVREPFVL